MATINFSKKVAETKDSKVFEVNAKDAKNRDAYYFVKVPTSNVLPFQKALKEGHFNLTQYGIIVASGFGKEAPEVVRLNVMNGNITYEGN